MIQDIMRGKAHLMDYHAICTFVFPDYKAIARFMYDKEAAKLGQDHHNFMEEDAMQMMVGDEYVLIEDGKTVN